MNKISSTSSTDIDDERQAFEDAFFNQYPNVCHAHPNKLKRGENGDYVDPAVFVAWDMWQIARRGRVEPLNGALPSEIAERKGNRLRRDFEALINDFGYRNVLNLLPDLFGSRAPQPNDLAYDALKNIRDVAAFDASVNGAAYYRKAENALAEIDGRDAIASPVSGSASPASNGQESAATSDEKSALENAAPFGIYIERDDGTTEFQRTGKAFQPTAFGYKYWTLYAGQAPAASEQNAVDADRWRTVESAGGELTLRLHNSRPDQRAAVIDAARKAASGQN